MEVFSRLGSVGRSNIINTNGTHDSDTAVQPQASDSPDNNDIPVIDPTNVNTSKGQAQ